MLKEMEAKLEAAHAAELNVSKERLVRPWERGHLCVLVLAHSLTYGGTVTLTLPPPPPPLLVRTAEEEL